MSLLCRSSSWCMMCALLLRRGVLSQWRVGRHSPGTAASPPSLYLYANDGEVIYIYMYSIFTKRMEIIETYVTPSPPRRLSHPPPPSQRRFIDCVAYYIYKKKKNSRYYTFCVITVNNFIGFFSLALCA